MIVFALLFRGAQVSAPPSLSADLLRYLWDGCVLTAGINPFRYSPNAPELAPLAIEHRDVFDNMSYRELPTIYPPTAQLAFAGVAALSATARGMKAAMAAFDAITLLLIAALLKARGLPAGRILIPAWSPLLILEFAGMGHADAIGITFLIAALLALGHRRDFLTLAALAGSIWAKLLPVVVAPLFLAGTRRRAWPVLPLVLGAAILPFLGPGIDPMISLRAFAAHWRGNEIIFSGLVRWAGSLTAAKQLGALFTLVVVAACLVRRTSAERTALWVIASAFLLSPVLHPWYLSWLVPLLALAPSVLLLVWTGSVVLAYLAWGAFHGRGVYEVAWWVPALELILPLAAVLVAAAIRRSSGLQRRRAPDAVAPASG